MNGSGMEAGILRGMQLESRALRVGRMPSPAPAASPPVAPADDGLQERTLAAIEQGRREGMRTGYEEGLRKGLAEAAKRGDEALAKALADAMTPLQEERGRLAALQASLQAAADACLLAAEDDLLALCYEALCRIVGESAAQPEMVRAHLQALAARHGEEKGLAVHVHPRDAELLGATAETTGMRWVADPDVSLGGCIVRNARGAIDARLETLLAACKDRLLATRRERGQEGGPRCA
jgi:flagellar assembly protein FliH